MAKSPLMQENVWHDKHKYDEAERQHFESKSKQQGMNVPEAANAPLVSANQEAVGPAPVKESKVKGNAPDVKEVTNVQKDAPPVKKETKKKAVVEGDGHKGATEKSDGDKSEPAKKEQEKKKVVNKKEEEPPAEKEPDVKKPSKKSKKKNKKGAGNQANLESKVEDRPVVAVKEEILSASQNNEEQVPPPSRAASKKEKKKDGGVVRSGDASEQLAHVNIQHEQESQELRKEIQELKKVCEAMKTTLEKLGGRVAILEKTCKPSPTQAKPESQPKPAEMSQNGKKTDDDDDEMDLFGSDEEEDEEKEKIKAERLKMYEAKKSKKPTIIAKSNIILDIKPWDDETDMSEMQKKVREISCDGLLWGASKLVPLAYGIHKLQISCVVEDEIVSVDWLQEEIEKIEDLVQSVDIAAFNKV